jgi:glycosyltransferase involved in cell wall biosynthesis
VLTVLATHPIQYQTPVWKALAARGAVPFEVWYLTAHGVEPSLDAEFGQAFSWDVDTLSGYTHRFPEGTVPSALGSFLSMRLPSDFRRRLAGGTVDALLVPGWHVLACWQAIIMAHRWGIPVWLRGDSNDLKRDSRAKWLLKRAIIGRLFRRVDRFLCVGASARRLYESYGVDVDRLAWAPHAIDNQRFAAQAGAERPSREALRRRWAIPEDAFCVVFAGKFIPKKRPGDLVGALRLLRELAPGRRYHGLFVGAGELGAMLRGQCRVAFDAEARGGPSSESREGAPPATFAGFLNQTEISQAYVAADALVLPSEHETWGLVVNEALASGLPCIVSDRCGAAEDLVVPLDPTLRFPAGDVRALAASVMHLADHPLAPAVMAAHISRFSVATTVDTIERLWYELPARR